MKNHVRIGIVGSRRRNSKADYETLCDFLKDYLEGLVERGETFEFVSGGCPLGADHFAEIIAKSIGIPIIIHYPDKDKLDPDLLEQNPNAAFAVINFARNTLIARDSDVLIALVAPDRKGGTEDTIKKFKRLRRGPVVLL